MNRGRTGEREQRGGGTCMGEREGSRRGEGHISGGHMKVKSREEKG